MIKLTVVRDALHGGIELSGLEEAIVDTPYFQRLRYVRQLATVYLVYPCANHTRFEHSLGTMHLTGKVGARIGLKKSDLATLRLAGLLHDVGHAAFSHLTDSLFRKLGLGSHEERAINLVKKTEVGEFISNEGLSLRLLEKFLNGLRQGAVITGELGTDRMDYLLRDGYFTGVGYSQVDVERLFETLVYKNNDLLVGEKGLVAAESLLISRNFMFNAVYLHPAVRITQGMLLKSIEVGLREKQICVDDLVWGGDYSVTEKLLMEGNALSNQLTARKLFKKALVLPVFDASKKQARKISKPGFAQELTKFLLEEGIEFEDFVVCAPPSRKKTDDLRVLEKNGSIISLEKASRISSMLNWESNRDSLIVACPKQLTEKVRKKAVSFLN